MPSRLWRVGRSHDSRVFLRKLNHDNSDFVVDVLIDASGSQRKRQGQVAMQAYILSEALSIANVPHRVMSFCTFWDYTILHRFREYEDDRSANENIFEYNTSSNNRDGLAIKAAGYELLNREEEHKILIVLSDGRPYDVILNRPNARNPQPYQESMRFQILHLKYVNYEVKVFVCLEYLQEKKKIYRQKKRSLEKILPIFGMWQDFQGL